MCSLIDHTHPLYTNEAAAFLHKKQRRTSKIRFHSTSTGPKYFTHDFNEFKFSRTHSSSTSSPSVQNHIHLSDDSGDSDTTPQTPTTVFPHSNSEDSAESTYNLGQSSQAPPQHTIQDAIMNDVQEDPFFANHGADFMTNNPHTIRFDLKEVKPINTLAQQSSLVQKIDSMPSYLPHHSAAIFWKQATDYFQYYDEFFTSLHTLSTTWSQIPFQKSWLLYSTSWQASLPNDSACLGMLVVNAHESKRYWELLEMAPSVTPRFIYAMDSLLYKPSSTSPLVLSPLNWFFQLRWQQYVWQHHSITHRVNHRKFYHLYQPFAAPDFPIKWHPPLVHAPYNRYQESHTKLLKKKLRKHRADIEPPPAKKLHSTSEVHLLNTTATSAISASMGLSEVVPQQSLLPQ